MLHTKPPFCDFFAIQMLKGTDSCCKHVDLALTMAILPWLSCGEKGNSELLEPQIDQFTGAKAETCFFYLHITVKISIARIVFTNTIQMSSTGLN